MSKNVLLVMLEFDNWTQARAWSYTGAYAFHDGLVENGHRCTLLPALWDRDPGAADSYLHHAPALLDGETFDEAWVWCVHTRYDEAFWHWLKQVAPVRVGVVMESLSVSEAEATEFPQFAQRKLEVFDQLRHCTHALVADELDAPTITEELGIPATWNVVMVPERFVRFDEAPDVPQAAFIGNKYGPRKPYLEDPALAPLLTRPHLPERDTDLPARFDQLHAEARTMLLSDTPSRADLDAFTTGLRALREALFVLHLDGIRMGFANVNLPSMLRAYAGRVTESMAAATPAVSWLPEDRADCARLFAAAKEIVLFDSPESLRSQLERLRDEPVWRNELATAARNTLLVRHTSRIRMRQYQAWIETGTAPDFFSDIGYKPDVEESRYYRHFFAEVPSWSRPTPNGDERARWEKIQQLVEYSAPAAGQSREIVEIGCGRGWLANLLRDYGKVLGTEPVGDVIAHARKLFPDLDFLTGSAEVLHFLGHAGRYDLLVCSEVIEHVPYAYKDVFARGLVGLVKPGGHLILTTPRKDIYDQWTAQYGKPQQPTEDWLTEAELQTLFENEGCTTLRLERAFLLDIYQIVLFQRTAKPQ